jgi:simple sugar transport system permease protein
MLAAVMVAASGPALMAALPHGLALALLFVLAAGVGAAWALIPALLRAYHGVNEIITTLMMTFIGTGLSALLVKTVFNDPSTTVPQTVVLPVEDRLPRLFGTHIHSGVLLGLALILVIHVVMTRTAFGLKAQVIGHNPRAALHVGLNVPGLTVAVFALSAGLAGLAGGTEVLGVFGLVQNEWNPAYGLLIVPLVFLARFHGVATIAFVAFFAMLSIGGESASRKADLPNFFLLVIVALLLIFMALAEYLDARWRQARR